jgi:ABC-type multidrug transport system ATPase subunit
MTAVTGSHVFKYFGTRCILQDLSFSFCAPQAVWIAGPNGSGKSTLLALMAGLLTPEKGVILWELNGQPTEASRWRRHLSLAAPYQALPEWLTVQELIRFQGRFRNWVPGISESDVVELCRLENHKHQQISRLSSGMRQRLRLGLAWAMDSRAVFLDEPCTHLDADGESWYQTLYERFGRERLVIVCSNNTPAERAFCKETFTLTMR